MHRVVVDEKFQIIKEPLAMSRVREGYGARLGQVHVELQRRSGVVHVALARVNVFAFGRAGAVLCMFMNTIYIYIYIYIYFYTLYTSLVGLSLYDGGCFSLQRVYVCGGMHA
jgi:hypothetical protein